MTLIGIARSDGFEVFTRPDRLDLPDGADMADLVRERLGEREMPILDVSAVSRKGLRELSFLLGELVEQARAALPAPEPAPVVLTPRGADRASFEVVTEQYDGGTAFRVRGDKPERWVRQTDFTNDEAVGYLADRLARLAQLFPGGGPDCLELVAVGLGLGQACPGGLEVPGERGDQRGLQPAVPGGVHEAGEGLDGERHHGELRGGGNQHG